MKKMMVISVLVMMQVAQLGTMKTSLFYYDFTEEGIEYYVEDHITYEDQGNIEANIAYTLQKLCENKGGYYSCIPKGVSVKHVLFMNGTLEVALSREILNYGGTARETAMVNQLLATVFSIDDVQEFTLYIEGNGKLLVEGTVINGYTRDKWNERIE